MTNRTFLIKILSVLMIMILSERLEAQVYLDDYLNHTSQDKAVYYREIEELGDTLVDCYFYINGQPYEIIKLKSLVPKIKDGLYKKYYPNGNLHYQINFKDNLKNGYMIGYDTIGNIYRKDLYQMDSLITGKCFNKIGEEIEYYPYMIYPEFNNGNFENFQEYIAKNLSYPPNAHSNGIEGIVWISFAVDTIGVVGDIRVINSSNNIFNQSAISVINNSPKWKPGFVDNNKTKVIMETKINYKLGY